MYIYIERERVYIYISSSDRFLLYIYENPSPFSVEGMAEALTHTHLRKALLRITAPCPFENFIAAFPPSGVEARSLQNIQAILTSKWFLPTFRILERCYFFLSFLLVFCGIFLDQGSNPRLLHWLADSLPLSHLGPGKPPEMSFLIRPLRLQAQERQTPAAISYPLLVSVSFLLWAPSPHLLPGWPSVLLRLFRKPGGLHTQQEWCRPSLSLLGSLVQGGDDTRSERRASGSSPLPRCHQLSPCWRLPLGSCQYQGTVRKRSPWFTTAPHFQVRAKSHWAWGQNPPYLLSLFSSLLVHCCWGKGQSYKTYKLL